MSEFTQPDSDNLPAPGLGEDLPPSPHFTARDVFVGPDGLRAGWSILLYAALLYTLLLVSSFLLSIVKSHHTSHPAPTPAAQSEAAKPSAPKPSAAAETAPLPAKAVLVGEGVTLLCVILATWIMGRIERRPNTAYGLAGERRTRNFFSGLVWGVALLSLLIFGLRTAGLLAIDQRLLFGRSALGYAAIWFAAFLLVGLLEEYLFRGYLQFTLARGFRGIFRWFGAPESGSLGFWTSAVMLSFGFGITHKSNAGESPIGLLAAGLIGIVFCLSLWRSGSLCWAIGFHASWDWAQSYLYGVADSGNMIEGHLFATHPIGRIILSGGLTGPEGSLYILPTIGLTAAVILLTLPSSRSAYLLSGPTHVPANPSDLSSGDSNSGSADTGEHLP